MKTELMDAAVSLSVFELWVEGKIDHNIAVPVLFNIPMLELFQSRKYSSDFLNAFEEAVEYETIRSVAGEEASKQTADKIIKGFKNAILQALKKG